MSKLFEQIYQQSLQENANKIVKIHVFDGNYLIAAFAYLDEDYWEEIDSESEWIFSGPASQFVMDLDYDGSREEDPKNRSAWVEGFQESRAEILKLATTTPIGETFSLYGNSMDAVRCQVIG